MTFNALHAVSPTARCRVAILGYGTVGSAVAGRLSGPDAIPGLDLSHIFDRRASGKQRRLGHRRDDAGFVADVTWTDRIEDILTSDADVVVEVLGGVEPAAGWIRALLSAGKSVVTANKQVIARHGPALLTLAARQGRQLRFEAAVGGSMPIVRAVADGLAGDRITRIVAVLNGTTNAVLSRMEVTGCPIADALTDARVRGYAESDASRDLDGRDAAATLSILCGLAFGLRVDPSQIDTASSASIDQADFARARREGGTIRQLAHAEYDRRRAILTAWVAPVVVPRDSIFGRATGPQNAALVTSAYAGDIGLSGAGGGGDATAVAIASDIVAIANDPAAIVPTRALSTPRVILGIGEPEISDFRVQISDCVQSSEFVQSSDCVLAEAV